MRRWIWLVVVLLVSVVAFGTIGFYLFEPTIHGNLLDAFYFTITTMMTVGFGDFVPTTNLTRLIAIIVVVGGFTTALTALQTFFDLFLKKDLRKELGLPERRTRMKNHIIICGYGNVGKQIYENVKSRKDEFVFIETDEQKVADLVELGVPVIRGDAGDEDVLIRANIAQAKTIIATLTDPKNIIVSIMAKMLNPNVFVVSEVEDMRNATVLKKAGADEVVHCHEMGARVMLSKARRVVVDPVCGAEVDTTRAKLSVEFAGEKVYFDSEECMRAFQRSPDRFMEMKRVVDATCELREPSS